MLYKESGNPETMTDKRKLEQAEFEAVLSQMPSGVVIAEAPSGKILLSNKSAEQIRRCPLPKEVALEQYGEYDKLFRGFHPDGRPYEPEEWPLARSIRLGEVVEGEESAVVRGDGTPGTVLTSSSPIRDEDGRIIAGVAVFYDITHQKQAEEELRKLNEELEERVRGRTAQLEEKSIILDTVLDNLTEGVLLVNMRDHVLFANPTACAMLGVRREQLPETLTDLQRESALLADSNLLEAVAHCAKERKPMEVMINSGETFIRVNLGHVSRFDHMRGGVLVVMRDLSMERQLEAKQQRFLANATHELKTPLTTILGAAELLLAEELPEIQRRFLQHIASEAERMRRLSDTMLRLARTGWDLRMPKMQVGELEAVQEAVERMRPLVEKGGITLLLEDRGGRAYLDPEWLEQALLILLSNAVKYSDPGGRIWVYAEGSTITIRDEGVGIKKADLPHVFERFYKGGANYEGSGLGLLICKELIERMGGNISIGSEEGGGTSVRIELRAASPNGDHNG